MHKKKSNSILLLSFCLVGFILIANISGTSSANERNLKLHSFDLDENLFVRTELGNHWEIVSQSGIGEVVTSKLPEKFKSDETFYPIFMTIGAIYGILIGAGAESGGGIGATSLGGFVGALIGYLPDLPINSYLHDNINVGWVAEERTERIALKNKNDLIILSERANIYDAPNKNNIVAEIEKGEYRKIIGKKKTTNGGLYKIKIKDEPIYRKYKVIVQIGWLKAEKLNPSSLDVGNHALVNEYSMLYDDPLPPASYDDWLKKGSQVEILDVRDNDKYSGTQEWFNGRWYRIRIEKLKRM